MAKAALVTGSASGLGKEFAGLLAHDGYKLILVDKNKEDLEETAKGLAHEFSINIRCLVEDLGKVDAAREIYEQVKDENLEILINNAGFGLSGFFSETDWQMEESMIYLHVMTPTHLTKLLVKDMIKRGKGKIMNVSSMAAFTPGPTMNIYYASKAYLLSFGRALANEMKGTGISVTTFCPGLTRTKFSETRAGLSNVPAPKLGSLADSTRKVAGIGYRAMMKGETTSIPLFKNRLMTFFTWLMPVTMVVRTIRRSQDRLQFKSNKRT